MQVRSNWMTTMNYVFFSIAWKYSNIGSLSLYRTENVTLVSISRCPIEWPNAQNCLKVRVAISLNTEKKPTYIDNSTGIATVQRMVTISPVPETDDDGAEMKPPPSEPELTNQHLREMWLQFGKTLFASAEIQVSDLFSSFSDNVHRLRWRTTLPTWFEMFCRNSNCLITVKYWLYGLRLALVLSLYSCWS